MWNAGQDADFASEPGSGVDGGWSGAEGARLRATFCGLVDSEFGPVDPSVPGCRYYYQVVSGGSGLAWKSNRLPELEGAKVCATNGSASPSSEAL